MMMTNTACADFVRSFLQKNLDIIQDVSKLCGRVEYRKSEKLSLDSLIDSRAAELLSVLQNSKLCTDMDKDQTMLSFKKFKTFQEIL